MSKLKPGLGDIAKVFASGKDTSPVSAGNLVSACGKEADTLWKRFFDKFKIAQAVKYAVKEWDCCERHKSLLTLFLGASSGAFKKVDPTKGKGTRIEPTKDYGDVEPDIKNDKLKKYWDPKMPCDCP